MKKLIKSESGMVVIEAAYVFPIMFFVIFFLIYMGNAYYLVAELDNIAAMSATKGAANCADPYLSDMSTAGSITTDTETEMYRYIFNGYMESVESEITTEVNKNIKSIGGGFFTGMDASVSDCKVKYNRNLLQPSFEVDIKYAIKFPIRFIFSDEDTVLEVESKAEAPVVDMGELIQIVDMLEDYYENTGAKGEVDEILVKIKEGLGKVK